MIEKLKQYFISPKIIKVNTPDIDEIREDELLGDHTIVPRVNVVNTSYTASRDLSRRYGSKIIDEIYAIDGDAVRIRTNVNSELRTSNRTITEIERETLGKFSAIVDSKGNMLSPDEKPSSNQTVIYRPYQ